MELPGRTGVGRRGGPPGRPVLAVVAPVRMQRLTRELRRRAHRVPTPCAPAPGGGGLARSTTRPPCPSSPPRGRRRRSPEPRGVRLPPAVCRQPPAEPCRGSRPRGRVRRVALGPLPSAPRPPCRRLRVEPRSRRSSSPAAPASAFVVTLGLSVKIAWDNNSARPHRPRPVRGRPGLGRPGRRSAPAGAPVSAARTSPGPASAGRPVHVRVRRCTPFGHLIPRAVCRER